MSIEVPVLELSVASDRFRDESLAARAAGAVLRPVAGTGELAPAAEHLLDCFVLAADALAVELDLLGDSLAHVAAAWLALDAGLLARRGQVLAR